MIKFSKFCSESLHCDTDRRCCVQIRENCLTGNRWNRALFTWPKKTFFSVPSQTVATAQIAPEVCHSQPPTCGWQLSKFHPIRFTFGGVIAGRVKAVKLRLKVSPSTRRNYSFSPSKLNFILKILLYTFLIPSILTLYEILLILAGYFALIKYYLFYRFTTL